MPKWYQGKVVRIEDEGDNTKRFWILPDDPAVLQFTPGQYITLDLPIGEKRLDRWRSYSIANAPGEETIELCIVHLPGGRATGYFFNEVKEGTELQFKAPAGTFTLKDGDLSKEIVMVCTGTGIAPFRCMIQDIARKQTPFKNIHLIFGTRQESGLLYRSEWEALAKELPGFSYSIALSRQEGELPPNAVRGYVHRVYQETYSRVHPDVLFYLCGWSRMIDEAVEHLTGEMGYDRSQVIYELYG